MTIFCNSCSGGSVNRYKVFSILWPNLGWVYHVTDSRRPSYQEVTTTALIKQAKLHKP